MELKEAIELLISELKSDKGYYISWQANIAMAFVDEMGNHFPHSHVPNLHQIANDAAKRFLDLLTYKPEISDAN